MKMRNILLLTLTNLISASVSLAQNYDLDSVYYTPITKPKQKYKDETLPQKRIEYFFNVQSGMLIGCNDCGKSKDFTFSAATVHGITIGKKARTGIGLGFDSYQNWQAFPLYGMVSWDLIGNKNKNALFVQMAYGWAHPWFVRDGVYSSYNTDPFSSVKGGKMFNPQMGYRLRYHDLKLSVAIGYKFQRIFYTRPSYSYCLACDFVPRQSFDEITQDMNRVQLMMSVGWK
jgi:hypothetical protein